MFGYLYRVCSNWVEIQKRVIDTWGTHLGEGACEEESWYWKSWIILGQIKFIHLFSHY